MGVWCHEWQGLVPVEMDWAGDHQQSEHHRQGAPPHCISSSSAGWSGKSVRAQCDNVAVVAIVNSGSSREPEAMHLLRWLAFLEAKHSFHLFATHIRGVFKTLTDALSRDKLSLFHSLHPQAHREPVALPESLLDVLIMAKPDWTSQSWTRLWTSSSIMT